jgi:hypothetical protein
VERRQAQAEMGAITARLRRDAGRRPVPLGREAGNSAVPQSVQSVKSVDDLVLCELCALRGSFLFAAREKRWRGGEAKGY